MIKDNGTFCGEPLINLSTRGIGHVQQCSQVKYIKGIPKKGTVDGLNIGDGFVYVDGVKQDLFNLKVDDWKDVWNSEYLIDLREKQAKGIRNPTCELCYFGLTRSKRYRYIRDSEYYQPLYKKESPNKIELRLSNECNLSCRFCTPINSSIYEKEMVKLGKSKNPVPDVVKRNYIDVANSVNKIKKQGEKFLRDTVDNLQELIDSVTIIEMHGGEPTLETKLWEILENTDVSEKEFICYSNVIKLSDYHIDILNRFKKGRFIASVDVADETISYVRYPAEWEVVSKNLMMLKKFKKEIEIQVSMTMQIYNMYRMAKSVTWMFDKFKECENHYPKIYVIQKPSYLSPNLISYKDRLELVKELEDLQNEFRLIKDKWRNVRKRYARELKEIIGYLKIKDIKDSIPDISFYVNNKKRTKPKQLQSILVKEFWEFTRTLDRIRKQDFYEIYPEFKGKI